MLVQQRQDELPLFMGERNIVRRCTINENHYKICVTSDRPNGDSGCRDRPNVDSQAPRDEDTVHW